MLMKIFLNRGNGLIPCHDQFHGACCHVPVLRALSSRTCLPKVSVVEEAHHSHPAGESAAEESMCLHPLLWGAGQPLYL